MNNNSIILGLIVVFATLLSTAHASAFSLALTPNHALIDSGQIETYTVSAANFANALVNDTIMFQLYNITGSKNQGAAQIIAPMILFNASVGYDQSQNAPVAAGYSTYLCATAANSTFDSPTPYSWWLTSDTNSMLFGQPVSSIGHQSGNTCSATFGSLANGDSPGIAIAGVGINDANYIAYTASITGFSASDSYTVSQNNNLDVVMVAVGDGAGGSGPLSKVSFQYPSSNYCSQLVLENNTDNAESVYVGICKNLPIGTYSVQTQEQSGIGSIAIYVFNSLPVGGSNTISFLASSPSSQQAFTYNAIGTDINTGQLASSIANTITICPDPTVSILNPADFNTLSRGEHYSVFANAIGCEANNNNFSYQWYVNGIAQGLGANDINFTVPTASSGLQSIYVTATDTSGYNAISSTIGINVLNGLSVQLSANGANAVATDIGNEITLTNITSGGNGNYVAFNYAVSEFGSLVSNSLYQIGQNGILFDVQGLYNLTLTAYDSANLIGYSNPVTIRINATPTIQLDITHLWEADVGQNVIVGLQINGGTPPFTLFAYLNGNVIAGPVVTSPLFGFAETGITVPTTNSMVGQINNITIFVSDSVGATQTIPVVLSVFNVPVAGSPAFIVPNSIIDVGQSEYIMANVLGGVDPYFGIWYLNGIRIGSSNAWAFGPFGIILPGPHIGSLTLNFTPTNNNIGINQIITVNALDDQGLGDQGFGFDYINITGGSITVNPQLALGSPPISITSESVQAGGTESAYANVVGGTMPYRFNWTLDGNPILQSGPNITINVSSLQKGDNILKMSATDAVGEQVSSNVTINLAVNQNNGGNSGNTGGFVPFTTYTTTIPGNTTTTAPATTTIATTTVSTTILPTTTTISAPEQSQGSSNQTIATSPPSTFAGVPTYIVIPSALLVIAGLLTVLYYIKLKK